jgi:hypothetical protein
VGSNRLETFQERYRANPLLDSSSSTRTYDPRDWYYNELIVCDGGNVLVAMQKFSDGMHLAGIANDADLTHLWTVSLDTMLRPLDRYMAIVMVFEEDSTSTTFLQVLSQRRPRPRLGI